MSHTTTDTARSPYRWVVLALCWAAFTMTAVDRSTWGPASVSVGENLGVSLAGLGVFATGYYIGYVISNAFGGFLTDWLGGRMILSCSLFIAGGFMILFGETESATVGIAFQAGIGIFAGCDYAAGVKLISQWFVPKDRGLAMGVFMTATSLGTVIANAIVPSLIASSGWRTSYHVFGIASMVVAVLCFVLLRNSGDGNRDAGGERGLPSLRPLLHNRDLLLLGLAGFGAMWGTYGFITWSNALMVKGSGISPIEAGGVTAIFGFTAVLAKPVIGIVSDFFGGRRKALTIVVLAAFVCTLLIFGSGSSLTAFLWTAPFLGIAAYVYSPLMVAMIPQLSGLRLAGSAAGATNAFWQLGSTVVPVVLGAVFQASDSFFVAFATLAAGPLVAILFLLGVRESKASGTGPAEADAEGTEDNATQQVSR
ncbi:MFS transporter [Prauserella marina]|uniref:Sugar phosphate permease n=1 Tax=Prauserella marina TaxID=530584 RepID=A0A222VQI5_9PSEU|nr:MFS transporter [Prauserella marina]ASR35991.1 MFS transporter [Prauserella marina]PWV84064.1 sugar phosphate permease [Prauserella marina]SDC31261.1 Sugar phosphate permease [Prauserella marina]